MQLHNTHILGQADDRAKKLVGRGLGWEMKWPEPEGGATAQDKNRLFEGPLGDPNVNFHCLEMYLVSKYHILCGSGTPKHRRAYNLWVVSLLPPPLETHLLNAYNSLSKFKRKSQSTNTR